MQYQSSTFARIQRQITRNDISSLTGVYTTLSVLSYQMYINHELESETMTFIISLGSNNFEIQFVKGSSAGVPFFEAHAWPRGNNNLFKEFYYRVTNDINQCDIINNLFEKMTRSEEAHV